MMYGSVFMGFHLGGFGLFFGLVLLTAWMIKYMKKESLMNAIKWILAISVILWLLSGFVGYRAVGASDGWEFMRSMMNWQQQ
ncbi:hypothetical protein HY463_01380 [Candidatus Peregrinibacteria bacterium]|nr:hypothetical protein [Candidatus Peregrinibacteria bacterium]